MEIQSKEKKVDFEQDAVHIEAAGVCFRFYQVGESLAVGSFSLSGESYVPDESYLGYCRETELLIAGEGRNFAARSRNLGGCGEKLKFMGLEESQQGDGRLFTIRYLREDINLQVLSRYFFCSDNIPVVRRWVEVQNLGEEPVGLEHLSSLALYHVGALGKQAWDEKLYFHIPYSSWSGEGQWQRLSCREIGLTSSNCSHYRARCLGSRASAEKSPMAMIEDTEIGRMLFWQIENSSSWLWEAGMLEFKGIDHSLYLTAGGPDEEHGHWYKELAKGESFCSVPVAIGIVDGGFEEAVCELTRYRRKACRKAHAADDKLPVIFNDYMNCLWGDPSFEKEKPLIEAAAEVGCEYYCIDSAWYARPGEHWWPGVGHWEVNEQRFPDGEFFAMMDLICGHGMVPGLWIEAEVVGVNNSIAHKPDSWFYTRHGKRIIYNGRYFLNFSNPEVVAHLDRVIDRMVNKYGAGYIKNDYNIDLHHGTETNADSFGDGLLQHTRNLYKWIDGIHERHPQLIWENCAAGGLRTDYGVLSHAQLQSSSDLDLYSQYSALSMGCSATVLPEQLAVWAYPTEPDDEEATIYNMVNALLCRIHLSGKLASLNKRCLGLVKEAIDYYKHSRKLISESEPFYPLGLASVYDDRLWLALGMKSEKESRIAVWRRNAKNGRSFIPIRFMEKVESVECVYPVDKKYRPKLDRKADGFEIELTHELSGRIIRLRHDKREGAR